MNLYIGPFEGPLDPLIFLNTIKYDVFNEAVLLILTFSWGIGEFSFFYTRDLIPDILIDDLNK